MLARRRRLLLISAGAAAALAIGGAVLLAGAGRPALTAGRPVIRLVEELARARRVVQRTEELEPLPHHLRAEDVPVPAGWRGAPVTDPDDLLRLVRDPGGAALALRVRLPVEEDHRYLVRATLRDPSQSVRMRVDPAAAPDGGGAQIESSEAVEERGPEGRVRLECMVDVPAGVASLDVAIEAERAAELAVTTLSVRRVAARDRAVVEGAPGITLHGLVERDAEGATPGSSAGAWRMVASLLASDGGVYEWALPQPPPARLQLETAVAPWSPADAVAMEMVVEVEGPAAGAWRPLATTARGGPKDHGAWRAQQLDIPADARALRLATRAAGPGRAGVVVWGNPTLLAAPAGEARPNVLLVTLDAVRPDHLSAYGYTRRTAPFLEKLAAEGARFEDVTAQRPQTWASTTSLLTGLFPETTDVRSRGADPHRGMTGGVEAFIAAGYTTGRLGGIGLPRGHLTGFDFTELLQTDQDVVARLVENARRHAGRPLFLWIHLSGAHYPWNPDDQFNQFDPAYAGRFKKGLTRNEFRAFVNGGALPEPERRHLVALYDAGILSMDVRLGGALAKLESAGFFPNAILAVTADHGAHLGENGVWFMHSTPWRASLRVPLVLFAPGRVPAGLVIPPDRGRVLLVDVMPTLIDLAGLTPRGLDGVSLRPLLEGGRIPPRTTVTHFEPSRYTRVEDDHHTLILNETGEPLAWPGELRVFAPIPRLALYDRTVDLAEATDLSGTLPAVVDTLRAAAKRSGPAAGQSLSAEARRLLQAAGYAGDHY